MSKLYYYNAIDALYMAEKFGVKFYYELDEPNDSVDFSFLVKNLPLEKECRLYIALESLEIFEPKEGDVVKGCRNNGLCSKYMKLLKGFCIDKSDKKFPCLKEGKRKATYVYKDIKIIQRNGIPFIMPRREDEK